jgi:uncharacterized delta-60 repeat protein
VDGNILLVGRTDVGGTLDFALARYNADGSLDATFGSGGIAVTDLGANAEVPRSILVGPDGGILVGGYASFGGAQNIFLVRYDSAGAIDTTFGTGGVVITDIDGGAEQARDFALLADGKVLAAGTAGIGFDSDFALVRYHGDGTLDSSLGTTGTLGGVVAYTEGGAPVVLDDDVSVFDAERSAADDFAGATLTLARNGGADVADLFSATGTLGALTQGDALTVGGVTIGTVTTNSGGTLVLSFGAGATNALVNEAMRQIAYSHAPGFPPASVQIDWSLSDGNTGAQGSGGALTAKGSTSVSITAVNDAPPVNAPASFSVTASGNSARGTRSPTDACHEGL